MSANGGVPWAINGTPTAWRGRSDKSSLTFTNCQLGGPTNFSVVVTNSYGSVTDSVSVKYLPAPTAQYPQAVLALQPAAFWRLNEQPDNNNGDAGTIANDYESGNNGIYTNVVLPNRDIIPPSRARRRCFSGMGEFSIAMPVRSRDWILPDRRAQTGIYRRRMGEWRSGGRRCAGS